MPVNEDCIVNLPDFHVEEALQWNPCWLKVRYEGVQICPRCKGTDLRKKDRFERKIRHESLGRRACYLLVQGYKFRCKSCGRYFHTRFSGVLPYQRSTEAFRMEVSEQHHHGITQKDLSRIYRMGNATVERWYQRFLQLRLHEYQDQRSPRVLGIDEHFFTKKKGYATTFCDLAKHRIFDVTLGRSEKALNGYLRKLRDRDRTQVMVMDLSETYRRIGREYFPNAKIVADRFHVIRLINQRFLEAWKQWDPIGRKNRGLLSLMRRHQWNLKEGQAEKLQRYFGEHPGLEAIYACKQSLCQLVTIKHRTQKQCKTLIPQFVSMVQQLMESPIEPLAILGKTLDRWQEEIVRMWRFTKTNGITEGFHNKMEMLSRRAYGFRNFENYRIRVKVHCS